MMQTLSQTSIFTRATILAISLAAIPGVASADCSDTGFCGKIYYLGKTADKKQAVFLSAIKTPGKYDVSTTAASDPNGGGDLPIDIFNKSRKGLRMTVSNYPEDWGGTHILYSYANDGTPTNERRFVSSDNQTPDGIVFPNNFKPPVISPPRPPVTGITPELPMGVKPPIGTLPARPPVTGVTPELPQGVKPPIGTLPARPPVTGVTPELPGGVQTLPGTLPAKPPVTGITPELPGGVQTLPGTLSPDGITPERPTTSVTASQDSRDTKPANGTIDPCRMNARQENLTQAQQSAGCADRELTPEEQAIAAVQIPVTQGREFVSETPWNTWVDSSYSGVSDQRNGLDLDSHSGSITVGLDRRLDNGVVLGFSAGIQNSHSTSFDGAMTSESNGFNIGPYIAYQYSPTWSFDAALAYGHYNNQQELLILSGDYTSQLYSVALNANGQYQWGEANVRPKVSVYYGHSTAKAYDLSGSLFGTPLLLEMGGNSFNFGSVETSAEINRVYKTKDGTPYMPYGELSLRYEFARANDGKMIGGDLSQVDTTPWAGGARVGLRSLIGKETLIDANAGYLSIGQHDLNVWELRFFLSHAFK